MQVPIFHRELMELVKRTKTTNEAVKSAIGWKKNPDAKESRFDLTKLSHEDLVALQAIVHERAALKGAEKDRHNIWLAKKIDQYMKLATGTDKNTVIKKVQEVVAGAKSFIGQSQFKWLFSDTEDGSVLPWFVTDIQYYKARTEDSFVIPEHTDITLMAFKRGSQVTAKISVHKGDLPNTVPAILARFGYYLETEEAMKTYRKSVDRYLQLQTKIGLQMLASGEAQLETTRNWWASSTTVAMIRDGMPTKIVIDDENEEEDDDDDGYSSRRRRGKGRSDSITTSSRFWGKIPFRNAMSLDEQIEEEEETTDSLEVHLPLHTYVRCFDMDKHQWIIINTENLEDYPWDKTLMEKLVLPEKDKGLINMLMTSTGSNIEDIVAGKMSGTIVLATGKPGLGKTLTAEVFSEAIEKPLYVVQCADLGLDIDTIEKNLGNILSRASRWGAILLIDEADVYIRERGEDITQNAIVGVFLRLLEYYRGVLFMTSNRGDIIDDAIKSRATAWVRYWLPKEEKLKNIWTVLGKQYKADFKKDDIEKLVKHEELGSIGGRTVRNLLKLGRMYADANDVKLNYDVIVEVKDYQALDAADEDK